MLSGLSNMFCCQAKKKPLKEKDSLSNSTSCSGGIHNPSAIIPSIDQKRFLCLMLPSKEFTYLNFRSIDHFNKFTVEKISFANDHCLMLLVNDLEGYVFAGFGSNTKGQLGLEVCSANDHLSEAKIIKTFSLKKRRIIDFTTCNDYSLVLVEEIPLKTKVLYRFAHDESDEEMVLNIPITKEKGVENVDMNVIEKVYITTNGSMILLQGNNNNNIVYVKDNTTKKARESHGEFKLFKRFNRKIISISAGMNNAIIALNNNSIVSLEAGSDEEESNNDKEIEEVKYFNEHLIKKVVCGLRHTLILCHDGALFSFGDNTYYQCGGDEQKNYTQPHPIQFESAKERIFIVDIACGDTFSLAKSTRGEIFIWGTVQFSFTHGEKVFFEPVKIDHNAMTNVKKMYAFSNSALFYIESL